MDERAIYEEILGQLAIIVNQQTQDIVNSINNKKTGEQQQIEVLVSGNTMSVIDVVTNNPETAKRVENVASSFEVLNQQLERYESIFKGIQGARYNGAGGQVEYIVDFLNVLSDVDYISKIAKANEILESLSKSVKSMIDIIGLMTQSKIFDAVESSSSLFEKKGRRIGEFFSAMSESLNYIPGVDKKQVKTIDAMIKILTFMTQEDLMKRISKTGSLKTKTARNIGNFFGAFADAISEVEVADAAQIKNLLNLMSLLDIVTREGFVSKMVVSNMFIGRRTGRSIGEFFGAFAESISSIPEFSDGNKKTVAAMLSLIGVVTGEGFLRKMVLANIFIGKKTATSIGEFFQTFGNLIASTPELTDDKLKAIRAYQTLISGIIADGVATNIWINSLI